MTIKEILDYALPLTPEINNCLREKQKWEWKRKKLADMIEQYRNGEVINFAPLCLKVDLDKLLKRDN